MTLPDAFWMQNFENNEASFVDVIEAEWKRMADSLAESLLHLRRKQTTRFLYDINSIPTS